MDDVGSVVLEHVAVGQIDDVVEDEGERQTENDRGSQLVVVVDGDVDAEEDAVEEGERDVEPADPVVFELVFELAVTGGSRHFQAKKDCQVSSQNYINREGAQWIQISGGISVSPVHSS